MIDNTSWVIVDSIFFISLLFVSSKGVKLSRNNSIIPYQGRYYRPLILIGIILFCLFNKTEGDYFHYEEMVEEISKSSHPFDTHLEKPFVHLINFIGNRYLLFRLIVWGSALIIVKKVLTLHKLDNDWGWLCFIIFNLLAFAYIRASIGISLFYLGFFYLQSGKKSNILLGISLCLCASFFHKSIIFLFLVGICTFFIKGNFKTILILSVLAPIILKILYWGLGDFLLGWDNYYAIRYFNNENTGYGIGAKIQVFLIISSTIWIVYIFLKKNLDSRIDLLKNDESSLKFVIILFFSSIILSSFEYGIYDMITRVREMAYLPLSLFVGSYLKYYKHLSIGMVLGIVFFLLSDFSYLAYMYYLKTLGYGI